MSAVAATAALRVSLAGATTFVLSFPYSAALVSAVKSLPVRRFDKDTKSWKVPASAAAELAGLLARVDTPIEYEGGAQEALAEHAQQRSVALEASRAVSADIEIPMPAGLAYLPFQRAGIAYAMSRESVLIGDEMGLGKTVQAIGTVNADETVKSVLVICPASLKINWSRELKRWLVRPFTIGIANGVLPRTDAVIINYDVLKKHLMAIRARQWDALIVDECHYVKNPKAQRTQHVLGHRDKVPAIAARRRVFLTGTPILNRPIELWPLVQSLDPDGLGRSWMAYVTRYCKGHRGPHGWDVSGASNLNELQDRLRAACMVRRLKSEVLTELPPKRRAVVVLPADGALDAITAESQGYAAAQERITDARVACELAKAGESDESYEQAVERLTEATRVAFTEISRLRHAVALSKVDRAVEYVLDLIEAEKVVVFAHHHDVIAALAGKFGDACVTLTGEHSQEHRQNAVDRFQRDPACRVFIGSIYAAGVGLTLTAAAHVVFCELDWVPGNMSQAEDRCHRIGQANHVLVEHLVLDGSLDVAMAQTLVDKQNTIDAALDDTERTQLAKISVTPNEPATASTSRKAIEAAAASMTPEEIAAVHTALRALSAMCDGAQVLDGQGFNKFDARLGHELAARPSLTARQAALGKKIAHKYRRQLGWTPEGSL